jgi:hypothetical protein
MAQVTKEVLSRWQDFFVSNFNGWERREKHMVGRGENMDKLGLSMISPTPMVGGF